MEILDYPTDTALKFWLKYWNHRIKEFCDLDDYGIQLDSPHFLLLSLFPKSFSSISDKIIIYNFLSCRIVQIA